MAEKAAQDAKQVHDPWTKAQKASIAVMGGLLVGLIAMAAFWGTGASDLVDPRTRQLAPYSEARYAPEGGWEAGGVAAGTPVIVVEDPGPAGAYRRVKVTAEIGPAAGRTIEVSRGDVIPR